MAMDNMSIRKQQLGRLDDFVHELFKEIQTFKNYNIDLPDLEIFYTHIHEMIKELLDSPTSDEFLAKFQKMHEAIAGVLIVISPEMAGQVKQDMNQSYEKFDDKEFENFISKLTEQNMDNLKKAQEEAREDSDDEDDEERPDEEIEKDKEDLVDTLDLKDHVKKNSGKTSRPATTKDNNKDSFVDPLSDFWGKA